MITGATGIAINGTPLIKLIGKNGGEEMITFADLLDYTLVIIAILSFAYQTKRK